MRMIKSIRLGCDDIEKGRAFYDTTFATLGGPLSSAPDGYPILMYKLEDSPLLLLGKALNGEPTCHANGGTVLFEAPSEDAVRAWHAAGIENGGSCAGEPEAKTQAGGAFGAYLLDPEGNKLGAYYKFPMA